MCFGHFNIDLRFQILTEVQMSMVVFSGVTPCCFIDDAKISITLLPEHYLYGVL